MNRCDLLDAGGVFRLLNALLIVSDRLAFEFRLNLAIWFASSRAILGNVHRVLNETPCRKTTRTYEYTKRIRDYDFMTHNNQFIRYILCVLLFILWLSLVKVFSFHNFICHQQQKIKIHLSIPQCSVPLWCHYNGFRHHWCTVGHVHCTKA